MNYFKNENNEIFAYDDEQIAQGYGKDLTPITQADVDAINKAKEDAYKATDEYKISEAKAYLANTDYKMLPNYVPKPDEDLDAIVVKRNETREFIRSAENN